MRKILVIPSCREVSLRDFLRAWDGVGDWDELIVVEDGPTRTFDLPDSVGHYAWDDIARTLGEDAWIISRRDSAIRSFGFLMAYRAGADLIATLDDDCFPGVRGGGMPICTAHARAMEQPRWVESIPGMRTRGLPYRNLGKLRAAANVGLWSDVPDLDAVQTLAGHPNASGGFRPPAGSRLVPAGQYFPLCGMNLAFLRAAAPLFYFPLMGDGSPYRRFDDIWCGILAKKAMDHLGWHVSVGEPVVRHVRASDPMVNLVKEAPGIARNETLWEEVDRIPLTAREPAACMAELSDALARDGSDEYARTLGRALGAWAALFRTSRRGEDASTATERDIAQPRIADLVPAA